MTRTGDLTVASSVFVGVTGMNGITRNDFNSSDFPYQADFDAGASTAEVTVTINDDGAGDDGKTEMLSFGLSPHNGATIGFPNTATLSISDPKPPPPPAPSTASLAAASLFSRALIRSPNLVDDVVAIQP